MYTKEDYIESKNFLETADTKMILAYVFWFLGGALGIHRFILGKVGSGLTMLILFIVGVLGSFVLVGVPILIAVGIWWLLDAYFIYKIIEDKRLYSKMVIEDFGNENKESAD